MNDMGAAIEKAYQLIVDDGFIESSKKNGDISSIDPKNINPLWRKITKGYIASENSGS